MEPLSRPGIQIVRINGAIAYILLYAAMYAAFGVASPFWPKFFETKALTSQQIGFILGAAMLVRLAAGPWLEGLPTFGDHGALCSQPVPPWQQRWPLRCRSQIPSGCCF